MRSAAACERNRRPWIAVATSSLGFGAGCPEVLSAEANARLVYRCSHGCEYIPAPQHAFKFHKRCIPAIARQWLQEGHRYATSSAIIYS
jgi:hypothetical protein